MTDVCTRYPGITAAAIERECGRELEARRSLYPKLVDGGRMTPAERDRKLAIAAAWLEDARRLGQPLADRAEASSSEAVGGHGHGVPWHLRRGALLEELAQRTRLYPQWISGGRLLATDASHRTACLESLLLRYEDGWDYTGPEGARPRLWTWPDKRAPAERQAAIAFLQLQLEVAERLADEPRRANALAWLAVEGVPAEPTVQQELAIA